MKTQLQSVRWKIAVSSILLIVVFCGILLWVVFFKSTRGDEQSEGVILYDTQGSEEHGQWKKVTGTTYTFASHEHIVFENALFRVTYPLLREDQCASHSYFVKLRNEWKRVTGTTYGDYTYFVDSIWTPPETIEILTNTPEEVTLAFIYKHQNYRPDSLEWAYHGDLRLIKIMTLKRGYPGVFVKMQSDPQNPKGEREVGFDEESPLIFSENVFTQPLLMDGPFVELAIALSPWHYAVSLPLADSFYRILVMSRPMRTIAYQPSAKPRLGRLFVNKLIEHEDNTYQVFLGAIAFDSTHSLIEVESVQPYGIAIEEDVYASRGKFVKLRETQITQCQIPFTTPQSGQYQLVLRYRSPGKSSKGVVQIDQQAVLPVSASESRNFTYHILAKQYYCPAGSHTLLLTLEHGVLDVDNLLILPVSSPALNFPRDVVAEVLPEMVKVMARFEAEELSRSIGTVVEDETAVNGRACFAEAETDSPNFLTFGPYQEMVIPGTYTARFYLKVSNHRLDDSVALIEVTSNVTQTLSQRVLTGRDFAQSNAYQAFDVEFGIPSDTPGKIYHLEFRVYFTKNADLWVDYIELLPAESERHESKE